MGAGSGASAGVCNRGKVCAYNCDLSAGASMKISYQSLIPAMQGITGLPSAHCHTSKGVPNTCLKWKEAGSLAAFYGL